MSEQEQIELELAAQTFADAYWHKAVNLNPYFRLLRIRGLRDPGHKGSPQLLLGDGSGQL